MQRTKDKREEKRKMKEKTAKKRTINSVVC
jgi:hypothetical protein